MATCIGCGLTVDGSGKLIAQLEAGGGIECDPTNGLELTIQHTGRLSGAGTSDSLLDVVKSPDGCNGIDMRANGIYAPCPNTVAGTDDHNVPGINDAIAGPNDTYVYESAGVTTITNNLCCPVTGRYVVQAGGLYTDDLADDFLVIAHMELSIDGGPYLSVFPFSSRRGANNGDGATTTMDFDNMSASDIITVAPLGGTRSLRGRLVITVIGAAAGAGHIQGNNGFRTTWHLTQNCC